MVRTPSEILVVAPLGGGVTIEIELTSRLLFVVVIKGTRSNVTRPPTTVLRFFGSKTGGVVLHEPVTNSVTPFVVTGEALSPLTRQR